MELQDFVLQDGPSLSLIRQSYIDVFYPGVDDAAIASKDNQHDIDANTFGRYNRTVTKVMPWVQRVFDLRGARVLEIGSGTGSSGAAIANVASEVVGVEPKGRCLDIARRRVEIMGLDNIRFLQNTSPDVFDQLEDVLPAPLDAVMLSAVLEHQTIPERLQTLRRSWDCLRPGGVMIVAETPNRLTYMDGHTSRLMFFDMLEEELALRACSFSPRKSFVAVMQACADKSWQAAREMLVRRGRGISYYDFDVALPGRPYDILADGYEPEPLEAFGITYEERLLQSCIAKSGIDVPSVFQRHTIYGIFQKPVPGAPRPAPLDRGFSPLVGSKADLAQIAELMQAGAQDEAMAMLQGILDHG